DLQVSRLQTFAPKGLLVSDVRYADWQPVDPGQPGGPVSGPVTIFAHNIRIDRPHDDYRLDLQVEAIVIMRAIDADVVREYGDRATHRPARLPGIDRLPIRIADVGHQQPFRRKSLQPRYLQIGAVEPDLAQNFGAISAAQHRQHIKTRGFVVELLKQDGFLFVDFRPQHRVEQMLRAQIFDRLAAVEFARYLAHEKLVFGRYRNAE